METVSFLTNVKPLPRKLLRQLRPRQQQHHHVPMVWCGMSAQNHHVKSHRVPTLIQVAMRPPMNVSPPVHVLTIWSSIRLPACVLM